MSQLDTYVVTFNCSRSTIDDDFFTAHFLDGHKSHAPPDIIVLCLQELAPIAYTFLSKTFAARYIEMFQKAVTESVRAKYDGVAADDYILDMKHAGMTAVMVWTRAEVAQKVIRVDTAGVGTGLWEMGNKGAVGVRLWFEEEAGEDAIPLTFVAAHLAPHEAAYGRRNEDWKSICQRLIFTPDSSVQLAPPTSSDARPLLGGDNEPSARDAGMFEPASSLFFAGDLNYRTSDMKPHPDAHKSWPAPDSEQHNFATMLKNDQLTRERAADNTLHLMGEADIAFPPSYKYSGTAQRQAHQLARNNAATDSSLWAEHRTPSWCDRILFLNNVAPTVHSYTILPIQPTSDHRPVALHATIELNPATSIKSPYSLDRQWRSKRAAARRLEIMVGVVAYLTLTKEGRIIVASIIAGAALLYFGLG